MSAPSAATSSLEELAKSLSSQLRDELSKATEHTLDDKERLLKLIKKVLIEADAIDEELCEAVDYLGSTLNRVRR